MIKGNMKTERENPSPIIPSVMETEAIEGRKCIDIRISRVTTVMHEYKKYVNFGCFDGKKTRISPLIISAMKLINSIAPTLSISLPRNDYPKLNSVPIECFSVE